MTDSIKYLIKFCAKEEYAEDLLDGKLFMNAAGYYRNLEIGQGDPREGAISSNQCIFANANRPIYCMYSVNENDIDDNEIIVSKRIIDDFKCADGWAVILEFKAFSNMLDTLDTKGRTLEGGLVQYGTIPFELTKALLSNSSFENLFIKDPAFSHQKEYRLVVGASLAHRTYKKQFDGMMVDWEDEEQPYEHAIYRFPSDLRGIARKIEIANHLTENGDFHVQFTC